MSVPFSNHHFFVSLQYVYCLTFFCFLNLTPFSPHFCGIQLFLVVTILSHHYNSRTGSGETKVESHASSDTHPHQAALLLNTARIQPGSQPHQCVRGNTVHLATWLACTAPGPPQESLVPDETRISLPAKPSLTRTTVGQLCVAPWTSGHARLRQSLGSNPESLVEQLALRCSALYHSATREALFTILKATLDI